MKSIQITLEEMSKIKSDDEILEFCEKKANKAIRDLFLKKITKEAFNEKFNKYCSVASHYRKKLGKPKVFACDDEDDDPDQLYQIVDLQNSKSSEP